MSVLQSKRRAVVNEPHKATSSGAVVQMDKAEYAPMGVVANFAPVQEGSGDPSPDNIRPISGWTGCNVYDDSRYGGLVDWNQICSNITEATTISGITFTPNADGSLSFSGTPSSTDVNLGNFTLIKDHVYLYRRISVKNSWCVKYGTFYQASADYDDYRIVTQSANSNGVYGLHVANTTTPIEGTVPFQMFDLTQDFGSGNEPTTVDEFKALFPKPYYPYNAGGTMMTVGQVNGEPYRAVNVDWTDEAGTVYGGYIDVVKGTLTETWKRVDLGTLNYTKDNTYTNPYFYAAISDMKSAEYSICSHYKKAASMYARADKSYSWAPYHVAKEVNIFDSTYDNYTAADFKTAVTGQYLCYELATPITYTLTPTQIKSLRGKNNVWTDTNGNTSATIYVH